MNSEQKKISPVHFLTLVLLLRETGGKGERGHFYVVPELLPENNYSALKNCLFTQHCWC